VLPQILSGKPKVYQGVRVKITVKELLQQRRARQAATGTATAVSGPGRLLKPECSGLVRMGEKNTPSQGGLSCQEAAFQHPLPLESFSCRLDGAGNEGTREPFDAEPISSVPNYCPSWQFSNCFSCEESPTYLEQLVDSCLQTDAPSDPAFNVFQTSSHYTPDAFQPVPLGFNQGLPSPFTPPTHSPPSALDTKTYGYPAEEWSCHPPSPYTTSVCCCTACGSQNVDNRIPQYFPCPSTDCMDYLPPMAMAEDFFTRDRNCDICYT
ncbi:PREDICTED: colorectal cancer-associated protein 2, partial [Buceros rhinoceros silvestris]|uniref:colorectal cancer-associated protein 2 n=1 Tax=Buceros rhinoceros silvestris TaxID=175836 RepID=UPI0005295792